LSSAEDSSARANDGLANPDSIRWSIIIGPTGLEELSEEVDRSSLRPRRLEHHLLWLSRTDHGEHSTCGAIAFYRKKSLVGYLPFRIRPSKLQLRLGEVTVARLPFRALQLYGDGVVGEKSEATCLFTALAGMPLPYDGLTFEETPTESALWSALQQDSGSFFVFERSRAPHYLLDLPSTYSDYFRQLSRNTRSSTRRHARELGVRLGGWEVRTFTTPQHVREMIQLVESIATKTFHYHLLKQDLTASNERFVHNLTILAQQAWLRGYVLLGNDRPVAYALGYLMNRCYQYELMGYDPEFAHASPGIILLTHIIEDLINTRAADVLDFGAGGARYKQEFSNHSYEEGALLVCRRTLYSSSAAVAERLFALASRLGAHILEQAGVKDRLKKFLRSKQGHTVP